MALQPGTTLGSYAVTVLIGEGGMGEVYQAIDTALNRQVALKIVLVAACMLMGSCRDRLPTGPSDLTAGIVIYEFNNYQGESAHVTEDISNLDDVNGPCNTFDEKNNPIDVWDDCISSVRVAPGWEAHLYEHPSFGGWDQIVLDDVSDLAEVLGPCHSDNNLDNCVSSIRVFWQ